MKCYQGVSYVNMMDVTKTLSTFLKMNTSHLVRKTACLNVTCGPGRYKVYGEMEGGYGWRCDLCPVNHYKSIVGDDGCIPCRGKFSIDNGDRTQCIDPYTDTYPIVLEMVLFQITLAFSLAGILATFATLCLLIIKRDTPIIAVADFKISTIHLVAIILTFVMIPTLQLLEPSLEICIARTSIPITLVYTLNVSVAFVKSQKILRAFLSKIPITQQEARQTTSLQIFVVIMLLLVSSVLNVILYQTQTLLSYSRSKETMERVHFCDTSFYASILNGFAMVIQLSCFVQAFRGRNLPSVMNDGMALVYASFANLLMSITMYIITPFQKPIEKELYQDATIVINTLVIFIALYGQKAFRILAYPHQNTKSYFREQRMNEMKQTVDELTRHKNVGRAE